MLDPGTGVIMFVVGGIGAIVTFTAFKTAQQVGPQLSINDLRPALPHEGLPLPVFFYTKPEILAEMRKR